VSWHRLLDGDGAFNGVHGTGKLNQGTITHYLENAASIYLNRRIETLCPHFPQGRKRSGLVTLHHLGVPGDIGGKNRRKAALGICCRHEGGVSSASRR
jgi:hypothetical protein